MRLTTIAAAATLLLVPASAPAKPAPGAVLTAPQTLDLSAARKKKEKVEYMRSAAGPELKVAKRSKKSKKKKK